MATAWYNWRVSFAGVPHDTGERRLKRIVFTAPLAIALPATLSSMTPKDLCVAEDSMETPRVH